MGRSNNHINKFRKLYDDFFPILVMFSHKYINDMDKAKDISQNSFIKLFTADNEFESDDKRKSFLFQTAKNFCLNEIRHQKIQQSYNEYADLYEDHFFDNNIIRQEIHEQVYLAVEKLPEQTRKIIDLSLKGYGNNEISESLGVSVNTVKTLKKNAFVKLRGHLKSHYYIQLNIILMTILKNI